MTERELFQQIGKIDSKFIEEAEGKVKKSKVRTWLATGTAIAACATVMWIGARAIQQPIIAPLPAIEGEEEKCALQWNKVDQQAAADFYIPGHFWHELTAAQLQGLLPKAAEQYNLSGTVHYQEGNKVFQVEIAGQGATGETFRLEMAQGTPPRDVIIITDNPVYSNIGGVPVKATYFKGNNGTVYIGEFTIDGIGYYLQTNGEEEAHKLFHAALAQIIEGGAADFTVLENPEVPELKDERLDLPGARLDEVFGTYLPQITPKGFTFESARRFINQTQDYLYASWTKNMSDFGWNISNLKEGDKARIVTPEETERYDLSLYPIPRADSVPQELLEVVDHPIFRLEDLSLEVLERRADSFTDKGDTGGVIINFGILIGEDILVDIRAKGISPQELFTIVKSISAGQ